MKGRFYKPQLKSVQSERMLDQSPRPWNDKGLSPSVYIWQSSIPEKLIEMFGLSTFQHISQSTRSKNTIEFLERNQKYINIIADSRKHTLSLKVSQSSSGLTSPGPLVRSKNKEETINPEKISKKGIPNDLRSINKVHKIKKFEEIDPISDEDIGRLGGNKTEKALKSMKKFEMSLPQRQGDKYIVNAFSLPKLLVKMKKTEKKRMRFKNEDVDEFFDRFNKKMYLLPSQKIRQGTNGWKLKKTIPKAEGLRKG
ncbi:hypothetical protein SteCoe_12601 [Stentor coeruleus]|uniref:Uncharacterized protein n=1 Tax=Stentor coeruleus TaxID=5963 RepID=A0A1R2CAD4_9CILI|nr:hypothetical protein SteCoe_12601 [Stentor coeruleus]